MFVSAHLKKKSFHTWTYNELYSHSQDIVTVIHVPLQPLFYLIFLAFSFLIPYFSCFKTPISYVFDI